MGKGASHVAEGEKGRVVAYREVCDAQERTFRTKETEARKYIFTRKAVIEGTEKVCRLGSLRIFRVEGYRRWDLATVEGLMVDRRFQAESVCGGKSFVEDTPEDELTRSSISPSTRAVKRAEKTKAYLQERKHEPARDRSEKLVIWLKSGTVADSARHSASPRPVAVARLVRYWADEDIKAGQRPRGRAGGQGQNARSTPASSAGRENQTSAQWRKQKPKCGKPTLVHPGTRKAIHSGESQRRGPGERLSLI